MKTTLIILEAREVSREQCSCNPRIAQSCTVPFLNEGLCVFREVDD
ncbi:hypothetical protein HYU22_03920 [Candidatus Woesearchaeota archaeon]|nr:hypothetical protein [Candidatus Woesearchaeota archaeon]